MTEQAEKTGDILLVTPLLLHLENNQEGESIKKRKKRKEKKKEKGEDAELQDAKHDNLLVDVHHRALKSKRDGIT